MGKVFNEYQRICRNIKSLTPDEIGALLLMASCGLNKHQILLIGQCLPAIVSICLSRRRCRLDLDDMVQECIYSLIKTMRVYRVEDIKYPYKMFAIANAKKSLDSYIKRTKKTRWQERIEEDFYIAEGLL